jgi:hypothetical protein
MLLYSELKKYAAFSDFNLNFWENFGFEKLMGNRQQSFTKID